MLLWYIEDFERYGIGYEKIETTKIKKTKIMEKGILHYNGKKCGVKVSRHLHGGREVMDIYALEPEPASKDEHNIIEEHIGKQIDNEIHALSMRSPLIRRASALFWSKILQVVLLISVVVLFVKDWHGKHDFNAIIISYLLLFLVYVIEVARMYFHQINKVY